MRSAVEAPSPEIDAPARGTVERWCWDLILTDSEESKLQPPELRIGETHQWEQSSVPRRLARPGRPTNWRVVQRSPRTPKAGAMADVSARAQLLHTFLHHELQAAELFAWAVLAFPETPVRFRRGLVAILQEELRHLHMYSGRLAQLGFELGDFPVRDWFWERVPAVADGLGFVGLMGMGLEAANLDHGAVFARRFRIAGDSKSAHLIEQVERDEVRHVTFARRWFRRWTGALDFDCWAHNLPAPLTPALFQGRTINELAREAAGLGGEFLRELREWSGRTAASGRDQT
jgi:uncharacterized ferritin-like protein (DUF455 family)